MKLLVVEDKPEVAECLTMVLGDLGHDVVYAHTAKEACGAIDGADFDAAVLDFELGGETSAPVADLLSARAVPFIVASGRHADALPREFAGRRHLQKPYFLAELEEALSTCGQRADVSG